MTGIVVLAVLGGCASRPEPPAQPAPVVDSRAVSPTGAPAPDAAAEQARAEQRRRTAAIARLLAEAEASFAARALTTPTERNALIFYQQVLKIEPGHPAAQAGLEKIVGRYIEWADSAMQRGALARARVYLERASRVDPEDPRLGKARERLAQARPAVPAAAEHDWVRLDAAQLSARSAALKSRLAELAERIRQLDSRVQIEAPSDAEGRWIYQQLNLRHEQYRIRASFKYARQPGVRLLDAGE